MAPSLLSIIENQLAACKERASGLSERFSRWENSFGEEGGPLWKLQTRLVVIGCQLSIIENRLLGLEPPTSAIEKTLLELEVRLSAAVDQLSVIDYRLSVAESSGPSNPIDPINPTNNTRLKEPS